MPTVLLDPVVPGYITSINPDFTGKQVTLSWIPSSGVVTYYNVVFDGGNGDTRTQTSFTNTIMMTSLTPGRRYNITITAISGSMTSDPRYGTTMTTATESISEYTGAVAGSSVTVAVLISVAILIVIIIKRRKSLKDRKNCNYDDLQMGPYVNQGRVISKDKKYTSLTEQNKINRYRPRNLSNIYQILMEMHKDSDLVFAKEFQDLEILSEKGECKTAKLQINKNKNRNENILPFDNSCVKLTEEKNNYINASFLQNLGNHSGQDFIVTQHPLSNTIEDFWTMIWEQNVSVIVMLTPQNDDCQDSYETYFPSEPQSSKQYGSINIETMSKWLIQKTESSSLKLKKGKKSRVVKHFRSLGWNDKYDRTMQTELVQLIDAVKSNVNSSDKLIPTVVHCGLGTGRSGVFIALYQLMDCIHDNSVDIFDMVLTMRERRMQLIENECQYIFIHDCLLHMMNENKNEQAAFQDQSTGDTYEYIDVP